MINQSYDDIIKTIVEKASIKKEELESKIDNKVKELDGFITKEGAAHIIATELKVKLFDEHPKTNIDISDLVPGMVNATVVGKVIQKYEKREFEREGRKGAVLSCLVGDASGRIRIVFWDLNLIDKVDKDLKEGDTVLVRNVRVRENNGFVEVHVSSDAALDINPKGYDIEEIADSAPPQERSFNESNIEKADDPGFYEFTGQILQLFEPRKFMACPECSKKVGEDGKCAEHQDTTASERIILNFFLDDGTSNIRCTMFSTENESFIDLNSFESEQEKLLFSWITVKGRTNVNNMTNQPEMIVSSIEKSDVKEQIKKLVEN